MIADGGLFPWYGIFGLYARYHDGHRDDGFQMSGLQAKAVKDERSEEE